jgi:hypothetical protein
VPEPPAKMMPLRCLVMVLYDLNGDVILNGARD